MIDGSAAERANRQPGRETVELTERDRDGEKDRWTDVNKRGKRQMRLR